MSSPAPVLTAGVGWHLSWPEGLSQRLFPVYGRIPFFLGDYTKVPSLSVALQRQGKCMPQTPPFVFGLEKGEECFQGHVIRHEIALQTNPASAHVHSALFPLSLFIAGHFRPLISDS